MRNLTCLQDVSSHALPSGVDARSSCIDSSTHRLFVVSSDLQLHCWHLEEAAPAMPALSLTVNEQDASECLDGDERVACVQYLLELDSVAIVCESGTLCTVDLASMSMEIVGAVSGGCASASWSPDQELLALTTQTGQLLLMNTNWNTLSEVSLPQSLKGLVVSWRGDGQYFVVAGTNSSSYVQLVYSRQGEFQTISDPLPLYHNSAVMTWRPAGNLIATVQQSGSKQQVLFYERNGLRFSEFTLPAAAYIDPAAKCVQIEYSCDSELLGVLMVHESSSYMLLFTHNNGHHYLKWSTCQHDVCSFKFDPEHGSRVVLCSSSGIIRCLNFTAEDCISACRSRTAGVVDFISNDQKSCLGHAHQGVQACGYSEFGPLLRLTSLSRAVVPPPMSATYAVLPTFVNEVAFCYHAGTEQRNAQGKVIDHTRAVAVLLQNHDVCFFQPDDAPYETPKMLGRFSLSSIVESSYIRQLTYLNESQLLCLQSQPDADHDTLVVITIADFQVQKVDRIDLPGRALRLQPLKPDLDDYFVSVELVNGCVYRLEKALTLSLFHTLPAPALSYSLATFGTETVVLSLDARRRLHANSTLLVSQCTSFLVHSQHVLITLAPGGATHTLLSLPLSKALVLPLSLPEQECRDVERGSRLVACCPGSEKTIMQLPRGNLEGIFPRPLILHAIRSMLVQKRFKAAFLCMRTHRVDFNLFFDHSLAQFVQSVEEIVRQINDIDHLNLLIQSVSNDNVTLTKYPKYDPPQCENAAALVTDNQQVDDELNEFDEKINPTACKVNTVCHAFAQCLQTKPEFVLCLLCCYLKQEPACVPQALRYIRNIRSQEEQGVTPVVSSAEALKFVIFLADADVLFDCALGLYDVDLVLMVAQYSQRDPKEYLPFLSRLQQLSPSLSKHSIDVHLKRWPRALYHLSQAGDDHFEEFLALMESHSLYAQALKLCPLHVNADRYVKVSEKYAAFLYRNLRFSEAAVAFRQCSDIDQCIESLLQAGEWRALLVTMWQQKWDVDRRQACIVRAVEQLKSVNRRKEAAQLLIQTFGDQHAEEAMYLMCAGGAFLDALQIAYQYAAPLVGHLEANILNEWKLQRTAVQKARTRLQHCVKRLTAIRTEKSAGKSQRVDDEDRLYDDVQSVATGMTGVSLSAFTLATQSSTASGMSMSSQISDYDTNGAAIRRAIKTAHKYKSVAARRLKKKMKEGHPLEEQYVAMQIDSKLKPSVVCDPNPELCEALVLLGHVEHASLLQLEHQQYATEYVELCKTLPPALTVTEQPTDETYDNPELAAFIAAAAASTQTSAVKEASAEPIKDTRTELMSVLGAQQVNRDLFALKSKAAVTPLVSIYEQDEDEDEGTGNLF